MANSEYTGRINGWNENANEQSTDAQVNNTEVAEAPAEETSTGKKFDGKKIAIWGVGGIFATATLWFVGKKVYNHFKKDNQEEVEEAPAQEAGGEQKPADKK